MNIINPTLSDNELVILPRRYNALVPLHVKLKYEDSDRVLTPLVSNNAIVGNNLVFNIDGVYLEGQRYTLTVDQDGKNIFRGKILVTEFKQDNYTINNNEFVINLDKDSDEIPVYED